MWSPYSFFQVGAILIAILLNSNTSLARYCSHDEDRFGCVEYIDNYDGDTLNVNIPQVHAFFAKKVPVRVFGVDAPEMRTKDSCEKEAAERAKLFTRMMLLNARNIELKNIARDKYFRVLAEVYVDGKSLGEELIKKRLAVEYYGEEKPEINWCRYK